MKKFVTALQFLIYFIFFSLITALIQKRCQCFILPKTLSIQKGKILIPLLFQLDFIASAIYTQYCKILTFTSQINLIKWLLIALYGYFKWGRFLLSFLKLMKHKRNVLLFTLTKSLRKVPLFTSHNAWQVIWGTFFTSTQIVTKQLEECFFFHQIWNLDKSSEKLSFFFYFNGNLYMVSE